MMGNESGNRDLLKTRTGCVYRALASEKVLCTEGLAGERNTERLSFCVI